MFYNFKGCFYESLNEVLAYVRGGVSAGGDAVLIRIRVGSFGGSAGDGIPVAGGRLRRGIDGSVCRVEPGQFISSSAGVVFPFWH